MCLIETVIFQCIIFKNGIIQFKMHNKHACLCVRSINARVYVKQKS